MSCFKRGHVLVFFLQPLFCPQAAATCTACSAVESWAGVHASLAEYGFSESWGWFEHWPGGGGVIAAEVRGHRYRADPESGFRRYRFLNPIRQAIRHHHRGA